MAIIQKIFEKICFLVFAILNIFNFYFKIRFLGNLLNKVKVFLLKLSGAKIGSNSFIHSNVFILNPRNLEIGDNSIIGANSEIFNYSKFIIGDNVDIGTQLYVNTNNHNVSNPNLKLNNKINPISKKIEIGNDVWLGARVSILSGVVVNSRVVVGAGSLVTRNLDSGYIYAGVPAKKINQLTSK